MLNFVFVNFNEQCEMFLGTGYGSVHSMVGSIYLNTAINIPLLSSFSSSSSH